MGAAPDVFAWAKAIRDDAELSLTEKALALVLNTYLDARTGRGYPGVQRLASNIGRTRNTARVALRELERRGYLATRRKPGSTNVYERRVPRR